MKRLLSSIHPRGLRVLWWGFSFPHTLSSLHFFKPHSKCVSQGDCVELGGGERAGGGGGGGGCRSHVSAAGVSSQGRWESTGEDRHGSNCLGEVCSSGRQQPSALKKDLKTKSDIVFSSLAIFLATLCLLNMHFMLYLLLSSPSREQLALTLLASRAVQHCALYKSQQP